ncbi:hypothetical protein CEK29_08770 [Bordetella genomosp. 5]|uniref:Iron dicitrate transport regulator FecR n=1 Tax=Bordetella genomosp. 5 TaxID=1395608 RepID=A0A261TVL3_9BORD|nr:FecR domain-containing protein [Bordetella genomosp. 5]OZI44778.1 hypothetical protein CEK29_08770 [Bordetella genomosp. 5]OZI53706.1 hypothetical protein CAL25_07005 [Bordetella genomosp. 5]
MRALNDEPALPDAAIMEAAVNWQVRLEAGRMTEADRAEFQRWHDADPRHAQAWRRVTGVLQQPLSVMRELDGPSHGQLVAARKTLLQTRRRRLLQGALVLAGTAGAALLALDRVRPMGQLLADLRTGTGERRAFDLPDGSHALLDARSAIDLDFSRSRRRVALRAGGMIAEVQAQSAPDVMVDTPYGTLRSAGGRFMVAYHGESVRVVALAGPLSVQAEDGGQTTLQPSRGLQLSRRGLQTLPGDARALASWETGMLAVENAPLEDVVQALQAYYVGILRVAPEARRLPVFGVFALDDPEQAIQVLAASLGLRTRRLGWLISLDLPEKNS